jgi:hypothetical protein
VPVIEGERGHTILQGGRTNIYPDLQTVANIDWSCIFVLKKITAVLKILQSA